LAGSRTAPAPAPTVSGDLPALLDDGDDAGVGTGTVTATSSPSTIAATAIRAIASTELACDSSSMASVEKITVQDP
jgi:hypothetical protein